jgi:hypothetical protein
VSLEGHERADFVCGSAGGLVSSLGQIAADDDRYLYLRPADDGEQTGTWT